jgi:hypothetical protein
VTVFLTQGKQEAAFESKTAASSGSVRIAIAVHPSVLPELQSVVTENVDLSEDSL